MHGSPVVVHLAPHIEYPSSSSISSSLARHTGSWRTVSSRPVSGWGAAGVRVGAIVSHPNYVIKVFKHCATDTRVRYPSTISTGEYFHRARGNRYAGTRYENTDTLGHT